MNNYETPIDFLIEKDFDTYKLKYFNLKEVCQGGPEIGNIIINGDVFSSSFFGGPVLNDGVILYIPIFVKRFFTSGFKICKINMETLKNETIGETKNIVYLDKIENGIIYFFEDLNRNKRLFYKLV
jgi:hypothetical protein